MYGGGAVVRGRADLWRVERNAAELFVVDLRGFPGLGHLPLRRTGLTAQVGKEAFDVLASEVPAAAGSLAAVEELPHLQGIETPTALRHAEFLQDLEVALSGATR